MKLLFDQNLSYRLCEALKDISPEGSHVRLLGMNHASDIEIWEYARKHNFIVVTQDVDFYAISLLKGAPPQILWFRCGNQKTSFIEELIRKHSEEIREFIREGSLACLEIY